MIRECLMRSTYIGGQGFQLDPNFVLPFKTIIMCVRHST